MLSPGHPHPLGATLTQQGVNFALTAPSASKVELCLFDSTGKSEQQRLPLPECTDGIWHGLLPNARTGLIYGYRVHGPWSPQEGKRFNPAKLLLDPYAREILGHYNGSDLFLGHAPTDPTQRDHRDNAPIALKARVTAPANAPRTAGQAHIPPTDRVLYELHIRSLTHQHPGVPEPLRGTYAGLAEPALLDHLQRLGITTLSLMPVQHRADEQRLLAKGLTNHWGYNTIGWFAPEARFWSGRPGTTPASEFRAMADAVHARGMELVIDVVYNHSAESDELGPTLSLRGIDNALYYHLRPDDRALYENWAGTGNCLNLGEPRVLQLVMDSLRFWACEMGVDGFRFDLAPVLGRDAQRGFDARAPFFAAMAQDPVLSRTLRIAEPWDIGPGGYRLGEFPPGWLEWNDRFRDTQRGFWLRQGREGAAGLGDFAHRFTASSASFAHDGRAPTASVNFITAHDGFTLRDLVSYEQRHNLANGEDNRDGHAHNLSTNCGVEGPSDDPAVRTMRARLQRTLLATLLLSQGTPMLLAGDELGHSQNGNNNAYCQDNETTWLGWIGLSDPASERARLAAFVARLTALRREAPALRSARWWPAEPTADGAPPGLRWLRPDGQPMAPADWHAGTALAILFGNAEDAWLVLVNAGPSPVAFTLPEGDWRCCLATDAEDPDALRAAPRPLGRAVEVPVSSLWLART
ncbi:glycogen operon protein [Variovorax boronicumulans]|uniref:glycogen debranching protein GlgX n=1 Tax=Variovorax boronicumulans TaxID=436515 RepID=UPI000BB38090|nr:glycogen debranching protein GlgX [Variovorax boronicumulans]MDP9920445.1 glycogen operon protein [Variovorax boronicumulans]PBI86260.1 Glycogen debranching enzyme [Variovorax boronicumulans]